MSVAPRQVDGAESLVTLWPGAGALLSVVQTVYVNATEQTISLDSGAKGPGQNYITVQLFATKAESNTLGGLQDVPLANMDLAGEARGKVSQADMKLSPFFVQNAYGPFGYSMGRTATGDICMYAWQRVPPDLKPGGGVARGAINIRALICDYGRTEQELLDVMLQLHIKGLTGQARGVAAGIGAYGAVVSPFAAGLGNVLPPIEDRAPAPSRTSTVATPIVLLPDAPGPVPSPPGITIPAPPGAISVPGPSGTAVPIVPPPS
ncbi:cellulose biosynthesis protein BcsN [uncultured Devosia sp.]|uniref:cellulose biosynthesis protein BcsN n=1 Tax=uncultured Devosia sp. TaxID=211434 RepID=UPI0035CCA975